MPANNTNTRNIIYVGDDPEERKYINHWDSVVFDYFFEGDDPYKEDDAECKFLKPSCGIGYCIYRNVKDVYVKVPTVPYDGDTFAVMDITSINDQYVRETYWSNRQLIKENPLSDDIDITLNTAVIYIDNTYDFPCNTKVIYNGVTYKSGDIFPLENTCEFIHQFIYDKGINAWVVVKIDKECQADVDIEVRYWDFCIPRVYRDYSYNEEVFRSIPTTRGNDVIIDDQIMDSFNYIMRGIDSYGNKVRNKKWNYLPFFWAKVEDSAYTYIGVDYDNDYMLQLQAAKKVSYDYWTWDDDLGDYILVSNYYYTYPEGYYIELTNIEHYKASKGGRFRFGFFPKFDNFELGPSGGSSFHYDQTYEFFQADSIDQFYTDWSMYFTIHNVVDGVVVPNSEIFPKITSFVEKTSDPYEMTQSRNDIALFSAWFAVEALPWNARRINYDVYNYYDSGEYVFNEETGHWKWVIPDPDMRNLNVNGISNNPTDLGNYLFTPISDIVLAKNYDKNLDLSNFSNLNPYVMDLSALISGYGWNDGEVKEVLQTNIMPNFYGEKWQEILKLTGMIYLNYLVPDYERNMVIVKYICDEIKKKKYYDYVYACPPWAIGNGETGDVADLSALTPIKGNNVSYARSQYIWHMNEPILVDIDREEHWFKLPFYFNVNLSPNVDKIYGKLIESVDGIVADKSKYTASSFSMNYYLITEALHFWELWGYIAGKEKIIPSPTDVQQYIFWDDPRDTFYEHNWAQLKTWPSVKHTFEKLYGDERDWGFYYRTTELREAEIKPSFYYLQDVFQEKRFPVTYRVSKTVSSYTKWKGLPNERTWRSDTNASTLNNPTIIQKIKMTNSEEDISDNFFYQRWRVKVPFEIINKYSTLYEREWVLGVQSRNNEYDFYEDFDMLNSLSPSEHATNLSFIMKTWNDAMNRKNIENILDANSTDVYFVFDTRGDMEFFRWFRMDLLTTQESSYGIYESEKEYLYPSALLHQYGDTYILDSWTQDYIYDIFLHDIGDPSGKLFQFSKTYRTDLKNAKTYPNSTGNSGIDQLYPTEGPHDWLDDWNTQQYYSAGTRSEFVKLSNFNTLVDLYPERITDKEKFIEWIKNTDINKWRIYQRKGSSSDFYKKTLYTEAKTSQTTFYIVSYPDGATASYTSSSSANNAVNAYNKNLGASDPKAVMVTVKRDTWAATSRKSSDYPNNLLRLFENLTLRARFQFKDEYLAKGDNADSYIASDINEYIKILNKNDSGVKTKQELWKKLHKAEAWSSLYGGYNSNAFLFNQEWAFALKDIYPEFAMDHGVYTTPVKMRFNTPDFFLYMHIHYISFGIYKIPLKVEFSEFSYPSIQIKYDKLQIDQDRPNLLTQDYREGYSLFPPQVYTTYTFNENWWNYNEDALLRSEFQPYVQQYGLQTVKELIVNTSLQPSTTDDHLVYSAVFHQPIPTTNQRINDILLLFNSLAFAHNVNISGNQQQHMEEMDIAYTLYPGDLRYYTMYERARYNDGVWNYYDYQTTQVFERKWVSSDTTKYPPAESLKTFSIEIPDYKYIEYEKDILDKHLPRVRTKNPKDWIFIKRYGVKHYIRKITSANVNANMILSGLHEMYRFLPTNWTVTEEHQREYYYKNTSDPTPILSQFEHIDYYVQNDVYVLYNKNKYNHTMNFILKTFDMKRLYSIGNYRDVIWTRYYHSGWSPSWSAGDIEKENQYIDGKGQKVSSFKTNMPLKHMTAALYYLCAYGETVLSPQHNFYEMYASGAYHALLPNSDYSFGDHFERSYNEYDAATMEYIFTEPAIQSQHAYYTIDVIFYLNAIYKYDNQRRFPVEIHRKRFFYTKDNHDYRYKNTSGYMRLSKQHRENELFNIINQFDKGKPSYSGPYYEGTDEYINAASIYPERSITEIDYPTKDSIVRTGYRITYRITRMNGSFTDSVITVTSHSNTKNLFDRDIAGVCKTAEEVWGNGYRNINENAFTDLEVYNTKQNNNEMDRRITKIEFFDMVDYDQYRKNGASVDDAVQSATFLTMSVSSKTSPTTASKTFNDDVHGYGTLTCKLDPTTSKHYLMFYWKQTKPVLKKAYIFHTGHIRNYPDIPTNVPYYTSLLSDIVMYSYGGTEPIFVNANAIANVSTNGAFQPKNTEKGGILIRYENIETAKWALDKISPEAYGWIVQEFETQKAAQEQRLAEIQYILDTDDEAKENGQALLTSTERRAFLEEKASVSQSLLTTREQFYGSNCYLRIDIQISSPFISGQTHPNYKPDFGGIKIEFFSVENSLVTGLTDDLNTFGRTIVDLENINWNIFFEGQQYNLWDIPRLVCGGLVKSTHRDTNEILYTLFPYEYKRGTVENESLEENKNKTFKEFLEMNVEICDVDQERIPHGIICTRTKDTDVFVSNEGNGSNLIKYNRYSNTYLQTRKPAKAIQYEPRPNEETQRLTNLKNLIPGVGPYAYDSSNRVYLYETSPKAVSETGDYVEGSELDINGATQGRHAENAFQLKGGDDIWYKHSSSRRVNNADPKNVFLGNDYIDAGAGNDVLSTAIGKRTHDTLIGGKGDDILIGHKGDSTSTRTYIINKGDGHDIIYNAGTNDVIKFGAGISPSNVYFSRNQYGEMKITVIEDTQTITLIDCDFPITLRFNDGYEKKVDNETRSDDDLSMNHKIPDCFDLYLGDFIISKRFNLPNNGYKIVNDIYQDDVGMLFNVNDTITQTLTYPALILEFNKMVKQIDGPNWQYYQVISRYAEACGPIYTNEDVYAKFAERTLDFKGRTYLGNDIWRFPVIDKANIIPEDWDPTYSETLRSIHDRLRPHDTIGYSGDADLTKNIKETLGRGAESEYRYSRPNADDYEIELNRQLDNEEKKNTSPADTLEFYQGAQPEVFITETDGLYPSGTIVFYNDYELDSPENIAKMKFRRPVAVVGRVKCNIYIENASAMKPVHNISRQNISFYLNQEDLQRILGWKDIKGTDGPHYEPKYEVDFRFWDIKRLLDSYRRESLGYAGMSTNQYGELVVSIDKTKIWNRILRDTQLFYTTKTYRDDKEKIQTNNYSYFGFNEYLKEILTNEMKALYNDDKHTHCREEWNEFLAGIQLLDQEVLRIEAIMDDDTLVHPSGRWEDLVYDHVRDNILPIFPVLFDLCEYLAVYGPTTEMIETDQSEDERMPRWLDVALEKGAIDLFEHAYLYNLLAKTFHPYKHFYYDIVVEPISYEYGNVTSTHITTGLATEMLSEWYMGTCQDEIIRNNLYLDASSHGDDWRWKCDLDAIPLNGNPTDEEMKLVIRAKENLDDDNDPVYRSYLLQNSYNEWHFPTDYELYETLRDRKYYGALGTEEYFQEEDPVTLPEEYRRETEIFGDRYYTMEEKNKDFIEITPEKWYTTKKFIRWINNGEQTGYEFWFKEPKFIEKIQTTQNEVLVGYEDVYDDETGNWYKRPVYETGPKYKLENGMIISEDGITIKEISDPDGKGGGEMYETDKKTQVTDTFTVKGDRTIVNIVRVKACQAYDPYMGGDLQR